MSGSSETGELVRDEAAGWQRLDPRMLLVHPVRELVRFIPVILGVLVAGRSGNEGPWQLIGVGLPVALGLLRYLTTSFRISAGRVELRRGLLSRHVLSTPLDRVRSVDLTSSPIHRVLGLTTVRIGTGSSSGDSDDALDLDGLPTARARALRADLLAHAALAAPVATGDDVATVAERPVVRFSLSWLRYAPLTGSGLVITAAVLGGGSQLLQAVGFWDRLGRAHPDSWSLPVPVGVAVAAGVVAALLLVAVLAVVGYLVTDGGFVLTRGAGAWHVRRGLVTTRETSLDVDRVAGVCLAEPLALRLGGGRHLAAIVSGAGTSREERGTAPLVPPAPRAVAEHAAATVLGTPAPVRAALVGHGPAAVRRRWARALVPALALVVVLVVLGATASAWWLLPAPFVAAGAVVLAADRSRGLGHALVDGYLVARSGSVLRHREIIGTTHVIGWTLRSTWFQRRVGLTTLSGTTAGGRGQRVAVPDVPAADAVALADAAVPGLVAQFCVETV